MPSRFLALLLFLPGVPTLHAQTVQGAVVDAVSAQAVVAAQATLLDSAGRVVATARTGAGGAFTLHAPSPGTYSVHVDQRGQLRTVSRPLPLARGQVWRLRFRAGADHIALEELGRGPAEALAPAAGLAGMLWDSTRAAPLVGARVSLAGLALGTTTDADGRFVIAEVPEGRHVIRVFSPRLDSLGIAVPAAEVSVAHGATPDLALAVPPLARGLAAGCGEGGGVAGTGVLVGRVRSDTGAVTGARVGVARAGQELRSTPLVTLTDIRGVFRICDAPAGVELTVAVAVPNSPRTLSTTVQLGDGQPTLQDFTITGPPPKSASSSAARGSGDGSGGLLVRVVRDPDGQPLVGAGVRVGTRPVRSTDERGRVRIGMIAAGNHVVTVTHPSVGTRSVRAALSPDATELELRVPRDTTKALIASVTRQYVLPGLTATADRRERMLNLVGFPLRQRSSGVGRFFDEEDLKGHYGPVADVLPRLDQVRPVGFREETRLVGRITRPSVATCFMEVWIDDMLVQANVNRDHVDLSFIPIGGIVAVEIYRSAAGLPARYITPNSRCGVVLIWTEALLGPK